MNMVKLEHNQGFQWIHRDTVSFKGYFFNEKKEYLQGGNALEYFRDISTFSGLFQKISGLDGCFSLVINTGSEILVGVDCLSFFPLFYTFDENQWQVSDNWHALFEGKSSKQMNSDAIPEFLSAGFVQGAETLGREIYKTEAGQVVCLKADGSFQKQSWFEFLPGSFFKEGYETLQQQLQETLKKIAERLVASLNGRMAVVPLSGGYDSRLIVCLLKQAGYEKVTCLTYGRPNPESAISKQVAEALGYHWIFIHYEETGTERFLEDPTFKEYIRFAGNGFSMPYLQEYFAARALKDQQLIPDDAVFIPGHSGDWLAGSYIEKTVATTASKQALPSWIQEHYFPFIPLQASWKRKIQSRIAKSLDEVPDGKYITSPDYSVEVEHWDLREKLSKFIFHSSQVFLFFGYEVRFPLWDSDLRAFFRKVPFPFRSEKKLYDDTLEKFIFRPLGVNFPTIETPRGRSHFAVSRLKKTLRRYLPMSLLKKRLSRQDYICYEKFTDAMEQSLKARGNKPLKRYYSFNARICHWYLHTLDVAE
jgi:asparagine synthase (glutamine-hydrolysing)